MRCSTVSSVLTRFCELQLLGPGSSVAAAPRPSALCSPAEGGAAAASFVLLPPWSNEPCSHRVDRQAQRPAAPAHRLVSGSGMKSHPRTAGVASSNGLTQQLRTAEETPSPGHMRPQRPLRGNSPASPALLHGPSQVTACPHGAEPNLGLSWSVTESCGSTWIRTRVWVWAWSAFTDSGAALLTSVEWRHGVPHSQ